MFHLYFPFSSTSFNFLFFPGIIHSLSCRNRLAQGLFLAWVWWGLSYDRNRRFLVGKTEKKGITGIWISLCLSVWHQSWLKNKMKGINRRGKHVGFTTEKRDFSRRKRKKMGWGRIRMRWRIKTLERRIKPKIQNDTAWGLHAILSSILIGDSALCHMKMKCPAMEQRLENLFHRPLWL